MRGRGSRLALVFGVLAVGLPYTWGLNTVGSRQNVSIWPPRKEAGWRPGSLDPVVLLDRTRGMLKAAVGRTEVALAEAQDQCSKRGLTAEHCASDKKVLKLRGKLNRMRSTTKMFQELKQKENAGGLNEQADRARQELQNISAEVTEEETYLGRHVRASSRLRAEVATAEGERTTYQRRMGLLATRVHAEQRRTSNLDRKQRELRRLSVLMASVLRGALRGVALSSEASKAKMLASEQKLQEARAVEAHTEELLHRAKMVSGSAEAVLSRRRADAARENNAAAPIENPSAFLRHRIAAAAPFALAGAAASRAPSGPSPDAPAPDEAADAVVAAALAHPRPGPPSALEAHALDADDEELARLVAKVDNGAEQADESRDEDVAGDTDAEDDSEDEDDDGPEGAGDSAGHDESRSEEESDDE